MILQACRGIPPAWSTPDLCIVGAGPAGLAIAHALLGQTRLRVLILEAGGERFDAQGQDQYQGTRDGDRHAPLVRARWIGLGGASRIWAGWCRPLDPLDFEPRHGFPVPGWPLSAADLSPHVAQAAALCGLDARGFELDAWKNCFPDQPLVAEGEIVHRVFQVRRVDFGKALATDIAQAPNHLLTLETPVMRLRRHPEQARRWGVEVQTAAGRQTLWPTRLVLACGGLENARLLLLSDETPDQVPGNAGDCVGRYFTEHGFADPGWFVPRDPGRSLAHYFPVQGEARRDVGMARAARRQALARPVLTLHPEVFRREGLLNAMLYFYPAYESHPDFAHPSVRAALELWEVVKGQGVPMKLWPYAREALRAPLRVLHAVWRQSRVRGPQPRWRLRVYFECMPCAENRISLGNKRDAWGRPRMHLSWRLQRRDLESVHRFAQYLDRQLREVGAGHLILPPEAEGWRAVTECGKHPMGATRMATDPAHGVVDSDCRVFGTDNLYVAGSSVFPTVGYANPTLMIVALALRLATHLGQHGDACRSSPLS